MILNDNSTLRFFTFSNLSAFDAIRHGVFTRTNGFSTGHYQSLNAGFSVGDSKKSVEKNRTAVARCMEAETLVFAHQIHDTGILVLKKNNERRRPSAIDSVSSADAMITDIGGKSLAIQLADCQGILLYDPEKKVVANVHSGWRGSVKNILGECVSSMQAEFGCRPKDIYAGISPSLGPCCAEFIHYRHEIPEQYWGYKNPDSHFDFWKISRHQLINAGLLSQHIEISGICTKCNSHLFYSFRKKKQTGRFVSVIGLK